jgi:hypothetical protein
MVGPSPGRYCKTLLTSAAIFINASITEIDWDKAEREIRRLPPSTITELPREIASSLETQGCTIPQVYDRTQPSNVIKGSFADRGQTDWAVLCSRNGRSSLLIFWGGPSRCPPQPLDAADRDFLQGVLLGDVAGYSRQIDAIGRDRIVEFYFNVEGGFLPSVDHQAIEHMFVDKSSVAYYCYRGKWLVLTGEGH